MKKKEIIGKCPMCGKEKKLILSHIIPEGLHKPLYDEINRVVFSSVSRNKTMYIQNGRKEHLLCEDCDREFGVYDKFIKELIYDEKSVKKEIVSLSNEIKGVLWSGFDYEKFKLFFLSLIFRANFSKEVSKGISLTEKEIREIKSYLEEKKAPSKFKFPIFGYMLTYNGEALGKNDIITYGNLFNGDGQFKMASFTFGGILWSCVLDNIPKDEWAIERLEKLFVDRNEKGQGKIIFIDYEIEGSWIFKHYSESIIRAENYYKKKR